MEYNRADFVNECQRSGFFGHWGNAKMILNECHYCYSESVKLAAFFCCNTCLWWCFVISKICVKYQNSTDKKDQSQTYCLKLNVRKIELWHSSCTNHHFLPSCTIEKWLIYSHCKTIIQFWWTLFDDENANIYIWKIAFSRRSCIKFNY